MPVLTISVDGAALHGKAAASIVAAAGAPPFFTAATDFADFERRALLIAAAYERARTGAAREDGDEDLLWRPRHDAPLWDAKQWVRDYEGMLLAFLREEEARQRRGEAAAAREL